MQNAPDVETGAPFLDVLFTDSERLIKQRLDTHCQKRVACACEQACVRVVRAVRVQAIALCISNFKRRWKRT
jgi:hypothetical protein